jgi:hypothetical protein
MLADAVFGEGASASCELRVSGARVRATLTPAAPRTPAPGRAGVEYVGTLTVRFG